jgi:thermitase
VGSSRGRGRTLSPVAWLLLGALSLGASGERGLRFERPVDPDLPWQWNVENTGQPIQRNAQRYGLADADIDAVEVWAAGHRGAGVTIALIGLGFPYRGSSLERALWNNPDEIPANGIDDDGNGWIDDLIGLDLGEHDVDPDYASHHDLIVAEIALAPHDDRASAGIAPNARLMLVKIADDSGRILNGPLPTALRYAVNKGARVILLPWTLRSSACGHPETATLDRVLTEISERALIVGGRPGDWPACLPAVVSVQATDAEDWPVSPPSSDVEIAAPGGDGRDGVFVSYAIGAVGGVAALLFAQNPSLTPAQVRGRLAETADRVRPELAPYFEGRNEFFGAGRINAARALGTDFDADGLPDADDQDADGDALPDYRDPCPLDSDPSCEPGPGAPHERPTLPMLGPGPRPLPTLE